MIKEAIAGLLLSLFYCPVFSCMHVLIPGEVKQCDRLCKYIFQHEK